MPQSCPHTHVMQWGKARNYSRAKTTFFFPAKRIVVGGDFFANLLPFVRLEPNRLLPVGPSAVHLLRRGRQVNGKHRCVPSQLS